MVSLPADLAKAEALARFQAPPPEHINCGQAVLAYALLRLDEDPDAIAEAKYFGGGIAGMGEICGVLNGLVLALGVRDLALSDRGEQPPADTPDQIRAIYRDFADTFGARCCLDLTGFDLTTPEGLTAFKMSDIKPLCTDYVAWAIDRLEPLLSPAAEA
jgi:C_GCAxxG_C_C family probable redox protein